MNKFLKYILLLCGLLGVIPASFGAPTLIQKTNTYSSGTATESITLSGVIGGDTLIVMVDTSTAPALSSITDTAGGTISTAVAYSGAAPYAGIYYVTNAGAGTHTVDVTVSVATNIQLYFAEYSGVGALDVVSPVASGGSGTSLSTASITPTTNGDLLILSLAQGGSSIAFSGYTNGFTQVDSRSLSGPGTAWATVIQTTAGAISGGATSSSGTFGWAAAVAAFKAATVRRLATDKSKVSLG